MFSVASFNPKTSEDLAGLNHRCSVHVGSHAKHGLLRVEASCCMAARRALPCKPKGHASMTLDPELMDAMLMDPPSSPACTRHGRLPSAVYLKPLQCHNLHDEIC